MDVTDTARTWRIGELAGMAHVSVRMRPAARTEAGDPGIRESLGRMYREQRRPPAGAFRASSWRT